MAASTKRFALTSQGYTDVSEGAASAFFVLDFNRQSYNGVRLALAAVVPAVDTVHYQLIDSGRYQVGGDNYPQEVPVRFRELAPTDRVWVRADKENCDIVVHRQ